MPSPISSTRFDAYVAITIRCATTQTTASVPKIVAAAKSSGIVTTTESPNTSSSTRSDTGSAIDSPFRRSWAKIGSRSCWIAAWPVT